MVALCLLVIIQTATLIGFGVWTGFANYWTQSAIEKHEAAVLTSGLNGQIEAKNNAIAGLQAQYASEVQGLRNTYDLKSSIDSCCCNTQRGIDAVKFTVAQEECATRGAIHEEGEKTRALMAQLDRERLLRESAAKDARIASLEAQAFNSGLAANAAQQNRADLNSAVNTLLGHLALLKSTTGMTGAASGPMPTPYRRGSGAGQKNPRPLTGRGGCGYMKSSTAA